jgi:hypothetical protein
MIPRGPLWLVANAASGSNSQDAVREVIAALAEGGRPVDKVVDASEGLPGPADLGAAGTVAVFAGDGTVNALATGLEGWDGALLVLPGGTANLLARAIQGERGAGEIAAGLSRMTPRRRNCIRCAHGTALVEALAGPGATWSDVREELRGGALGRVANAAIEAIRQSTAGPMVALTEPAIGRAEGYVGLRLDVSGEAMVVEGFGAETAADYVAHGLALLRRNFREGPHDALGEHLAVRCRSLGDGPIPLMIDGERRDGGPDERFSLAPFALDLLGPPQ